VRARAAKALRRIVPGGRVARTLGLFAAGSALLGLAAGAFHAVIVFGGPLPAVWSFAEVRSSARSSDILLVDRNGEPIQEIRVDPKRRRLGWTALDAISPALAAAVLESEDRRFFFHGGVDARAVAGALWQRVTGRGRRGASTISMQVAGLVTSERARAGGPRTLGQKWRQMRLAWRLEAAWSKPQILEAYLNLASFRGELEGVTAASAVLFGKAPHGLDSAEAAVLAALLRAPGAGRGAVERRARALLGAPAGDEVRAAVARALERPPAFGPHIALAPHAARLLSPREPGAHAVVVTTLDADLQRAAAAALRRQLAAVRGEHVRDGAVLAVDNETGGVLAYVGGSGDLSSAPHVDGVQARRQAGSTLKPFLYGLALDRRVLTAATLLEDTPLDLAVAGGLYRPRNYDERFRGLVSVRTALASSLNVPAVRTLDLIGEEAAVEQLRRLGFAGLTESGEFYGPSMALGSADVSLWELVQGYRTLARGGVFGALRLEPGAPAGAERPVYSAGAAYVVSSILSDRESRSATFGLESPLGTRVWTAVKTGTSKEMRDTWCVGYSRRYTVGVWVGNFSGEPMRDVSGVTAAAPVWAELMAWLHREEPSPAPTPVGVRAVSVAFASAVEPARREWFLPGTEPGSGAPPAPGGQPRIVAPVSGTVIALDPDIPAERERLVFEAAHGRDGLRWVLDGVDLGPASQLAVWRPTRGRHALTLVDGDAREVDRVTFEVRGPAR